MATTKSNTESTNDAAAAKAVMPTEEGTANVVDSAVAPRGLQAGAAVDQPISSKTPRGVGEPPADQVADEPGAASAQKAVTDAVDKETAQGFRGIKVDPTPNENYTLRGVGQGLPTPETTVVQPRSA